MCESAARADLPGATGSGVSTKYYIWISFLSVMLLYSNWFCLSVLTPQCPRRDARLKVRLTTGISTLKRSLHFLVYLQWSPCVCLICLSACRRYLRVVSQRLLTWSGLGPSMAARWRTSGDAGERDSRHLCYSCLCFVLWQTVTFLLCSTLSFSISS